MSNKLISTPKSWSYKFSVPGSVTHPLSLSPVSQTPDPQVVPYVSRSPLMLTLTPKWWKYFHFQVSLFSSLHTIYIKANYSQESDSSAYQDYSLENWQLLSRSNLGFWEPLGWFSPSWQIDFSPFCMNCEDWCDNCRRGDTAMADARVEPVPGAR